MQRLIPGLAMTMALAGPAVADPLRDMALGLFGPLPDAVTEVEGVPVTPALVDLGRVLFFDPRLSAQGQLSCAGCHDLASGGDDGRVVMVGQDGTEGLRNTSTVLNAVLNDVHFWDGREADRAMQAGGPVRAGLALLDSPEPMLARLQAVPGYDALFSAAFPGEPITADSLALALEAFAATLLTPAPFDAWLKGDDSALSAEAKAGVQLFNDRGCSLCHYGPMLGGADYYPLGLVELPGIDIKAEDETAAGEGADEFVFRTAPLRNVALTAPYFHSGKVADLAGAVDVMAAGQLGSPLAPEETAQIVAFLDSLTGSLEITPPVLP